MFPQILVCIEILCYSLVHVEEYDNRSYIYIILKYVHAPMKLKDPCRVKQYHPEVETLKL